MRGRRWILWGKGLERLAGKGFDPGGAGGRSPLASNIGASTPHRRPASNRATSQPGWGFSTRSGEAAARHGNHSELSRRYV